MKTLIFTLFVYLTTSTFAAPSGSHGGIVLSGPSGVVTGHGPIGPAALGLDGYGAYGGHGAGAYVAGPAGSSAYVAGPAGPSAYVAGPAVSHASVVGPAAGLGLGYGGGPGPLGSLGGFGLNGLGGYGGYGGYRSGLGLSHGVTVTNGGGTVGVSPHGVTVKGPPTVPATIAGPAGKVVADGLYGVPTHGHGW
ncbi:uncharacterized protein [Leptinotarsa decemlineata]|uniref:uncharacterized protein n=1 Tax=Leptinotarsa decemlineata TaxID=7539 RepID=UPI003D30BA1C